MKFKSHNLFFQSSGSVAEWKFHLVVRVPKGREEKIILRDAQSRVRPNKPATNINPILSMWYLRPLI